ncbi:e3 ubiquitin ligase synoviolin [Fusarium heterosporum]|uniref:RING-type E3 ubiquitin transferase n=1 Tax=Fusarium heterosporum TaxID=42747 RepID=A0A8H5U522_FUSHE|nr:e3 ubiquitin ligase synoviolin [Fusarium heterosporum]
MRLGWYAGASTALAGTVVLSAFYQRANFYSAMVYLAQSNFCLLVLVNFSLFLYSSFVYGLTRMFFGPLRAVEVEQLTERAWFAITETCLAMTIFREEIGAWFLVMFAALVTGKVWGWIGDGRVEVLEQQPPANPRLFHLRLSVSLTLSFIYDIYILRYTINTVIQQARPNMMVMFLFEFAVLATSSWRTAARYALSLTEQNIQESQKRKRLAERRQEVREEREAIIRRREAAVAAGEEVSNEPLPDEEDIDEMDIEVPGWSAKGEFVLWLDLITDLVKLGIYVVFFFMLLAFYGLPIHIMRDLFMTARDFVKRLGALMRYRKAIQEMNRYPDATQEELAREDTCIICREEMRPWDPENNPGAMDRIRPKKLPCGHILHLGCLKSWLERQQVCPTCRSPVTLNENARAAQNRAAGLRIEIGGGRPADQQPPANPGVAPGQGQQNGGAQPEQRPAGPRIFNIGPLRVGFGANGQQVRELAQQFGMPQAALNQQGLAPTPGAGTPSASGQTAPVSLLPTGDNLQNVGTLLSQADQLIQREMQSLQIAHQELLTLQILQTEVHRLRQRQLHPEQAPNAQAQPILPPVFPMAQPLMPQPYPLTPQMAMPPSFPQFPGIPPRNPSPLMARHGAPLNAVPIPAGSTELPEGVIIPPGWSLLPLQRLDGGQSSTQPSPQVGPQTTSSDNIPIARPTSAARQPSPIGIRNNDTLSASNPPSAAFTEQRPPHFTSQFTPDTDPPQVVAPSPRMPNWGGSAQLFGNGSRLEHSDQASQSESQAEGSSSRTVPVELPLQPSPNDEHTPQGTPPSHSDEDEAEDNSSKGKAKAVTVEDVEDEEVKDNTKED